MKKSLGKLISSVYVIVYMAISLVVVLASCNIEIKRSHDINIMNIMCVLIVMLFIAIIYYMQSRLQISDKQRKIFVTIGGAVLFGIQMVILISIGNNVGCDVHTIHEGAVNALCPTEDYEYYWYYYLQNPNNIFITFILTVFLKVGDVINLEGYLLFTIAGMLLANISAFFTEKIVWKMTGNNTWAIISWLISAILVACNPWIVAPYTDVFSLCIPIGVLYVCVVEKNIYKKIFWILFVGIGIGYLIKPTNIFVGASFLIVEIMIGKKEKVQSKKAILVGAEVILIIIFLVCLKGTVESKLGYAQDKDYEKSIWYYAMMGQNDDTGGEYSYEDDQATNEYKKYEDKVNFNQKQLVERIRNRGIKGNINFYIKKTLNDFGDGMFAWGNWPIINDLTDKPITWVRQVIEEYKQGDLVQCVWIFCILGSTLMPLRDSDDKCRLIVQLSLILLFMYLMVFEASARYVYHYVPIYIVAAADGYHTVIVRCGENVGKKKYITKKR